MFSQHTVARERERERERESVKLYEHRHLPPRPMSNPYWHLLTTFSTFANFYISKFRISLMWYHFTKLLRHLTCAPIFLPWFSLTQWNLWQDINLFCLHLVFLCRTNKPHILVADILTWTFRFDLHFRTKIPATKPDDKIINTINHHTN